MDPTSGKGGWLFQTSEGVQEGDLVDTSALVPLAALEKTASVSFEGAGGSVPNASAATEVDGDELPGPAGSDARWVPGVDVATHPGVLEYVNNSEIGPTNIAVGDGWLLSAGIDGLEVGIPATFEEVKDANISGAAEMVTVEDVLPPEAAAEADVGVLVPPTVLGNACSITVEVPQGLGMAVLGMLEEADDVSAWAVEESVAEDAMRLPKDVANMRVPVPPSVPKDAGSITAEGQDVPVYTASSVLEVVGRRRPGPAAAEGRLGAGVDATMDPGGLDGVDASASELTTDTDENMLLLIVCIDRLGGTALGKRRSLLNMPGSGVTVWDAEDDAPPPVAAIVVGAAACVPHAGLGKTVFATIEGPGVRAIAAPVVRVVDDEEALNAARTAVRRGSGVDVTMSPWILDDANASRLVLTATAEDDVLPLRAARVAEEYARAARGTEADVLLLGAVAEAGVEGPLPQVVLGKAVPSTDEGSDGLVTAALAILEEVVESSGVAELVAEEGVPRLEAAAEADGRVLVHSAVQGQAVSAFSEGPGGRALKTRTVPGAGGDELPAVVRAERLPGSVVVVAVSRVVPNETNANTHTLAATAEDGALLPSDGVDIVGAAVSGKLGEDDDANAPRTEPKTVSSIRRTQFMVRAVTGITTVVWATGTQARGLREAIQHRFGIPIRHQRLLLGG